MGCHSQTLDPSSEISINLETTILLQTKGKGSGAELSNVRDFDQNVTFLSKNRNNFDTFRIKTKIAISPENRRQGPQSSPSLEESLSSALLDSSDSRNSTICRSDKPMGSSELSRSTTGARSIFRIFNIGSHFNVQQQATNGLGFFGDQLIFDTADPIFAKMVSSNTTRCLWASVSNKGPIWVHFTHHWRESNTLNETQGAIFLSSQTCHEDHQ
jgi:hypothetical protein